MAIISRIVLSRQKGAPLVRRNYKVEAEDQTVVYARFNGAPKITMKGDSVVFIEEGVDKKDIVLKDKSTSVVYE